MMTLFICASLIAPHFSYAGEEAPKPAEEGGSEGGKKKASTQLPVSEGTEIEIEIASLQAKIKAKDEDLKGLIGEKEKTDEKDPKISGIVKSIAVDYRELRDLEEQLEKQKSMLRFRHPEHSNALQGPKEKKSKEPETLEKYEKEVRTNQQLDRTLNKVEKVYGVEKKSPAEETKSPIDPETTTPLIQK
jgi:chromosome segregation ATPase